MTQTHEELLAAAERHVPTIRARVDAGEYLVEPGEKAEKPVIRRAIDTDGKRQGTIVKGSGRPPHSPDLGEISRKTAHMRTTRARQAFEDGLPLDGQPTNRGTFPWLMEQLYKFIEGESGEVKCPSCAHKFVVQGLKRDARVAIALLDQRIGRAPQKVEIDEHSEQIRLVLEGRVPINELIVREVPDAVAEDRERRALAMGLIEPDWKDDDIDGDTEPV
jgi:hypothetical protein